MPASGRPTEQRALTMEKVDRGTMRCPLSVTDERDHGGRRRNGNGRLRGVVKALCDFRVVV
jgi:hypothetical protein